MSQIISAEQARLLTATRILDINGIMHKIKENASLGFVRVTLDNVQYQLGDGVAEELVRLGYKVEEIPEYPGNKIKYTAVIWE